MVPMSCSSTWATCSSVPSPDSLGCTNASRQAGRSMETPNTAKPRSLSCRIVSSSDGTLKVMWCAPGPERSRKRRMKPSPDAPGVISSIRMSWA